MDMYCTKGDIALHMTSWTCNSLNFPLLFARKNSCYNQRHFSISVFLKKYDGLTLPKTKQWVQVPCIWELVTKSWTFADFLCSVAAVNEEAAREALLSHVGQHCCYGKKAARELVYMDLKPTSAFHVSILRPNTGMTLSGCARKLQWCITKLGVWFLVYNGDVQRIPCYQLGYGALCRYFQLKRKNIKSTYKICTVVRSCCVIWALWWTTRPHYASIWG